MKVRAFRGFTSEDLWDVYEAENPLFEMFRKIAQAVTPGQTVELAPATRNSEVRPRFGRRNFETF
jgi:hypothetical protein